MATMLDADRQLCSVDMQVAESLDSQPLAIIKSDLRAAINAVDQWVSDNSASYNSALPLPARTALTTRQKARLLMFVLQRRYLSGV